MSFDFANMTPESASKLDPRDPALLQSLGMEPLPDYLSMPEIERYDVLKKKFIQLLVMGAIINRQREDVFIALKDVLFAKKNQPLKESDERKTGESSESNEPSEFSESS